MRRKGLFIALEGIDGCGKGTQAVMLRRRFEALGRKVWMTQEPTYGPIGRVIREIQKGGLVENPNEDTMMYLYAADRSEHCKEILEHLDADDVVICDRYVGSSVAYQNFDTTHVDAVAVNDGYLVPDRTFLLDVPVDVAMGRIESRGQEKEIFEKREFLEKVRERYLSVEGMSVVDGTGSPEEVLASILAILEGRKWVETDLETGVSPTSAR